jgi:hypothetical protein
MIKRILKKIRFKVWKFKNRKALGPRKYIY